MMPAFSATNLLDPSLINGKGWQVRLREIPVIVGMLFASLGDGDAALFHPATGLLNYFSAAFDDLALTVYLKLERLVHRAKAIHVLDFRAGS